MELSVGELVDRLCIINVRIALLEKDIRDGQEAQMGLEEVGRRALTIRTLNAERVALRNALNEKCDKNAFRDIKVAHASEKKTLP